MKLRLLLTLAGLLLLAACDTTTNNTSTGPVDAVVITRAGDYTSGAHSVISEGGNQTFSASNELVPTTSDLAIAAYGNYFYRIERGGYDNITKFAFADPQTIIWQYSTNDAGSAVSSNPHAMVFASDTKAYVIRYGSNKVWIVNPSATSEAQFKIGELDLSAYDDGDGIPEMENGIIVGHYLLITMQRLTGYIPSNISYVAVFDITTDTEVDTGYPGDGDKKGIPLVVRNPFSDIVYAASEDAVYVQGYGSFGYSGEDMYTGGIEKINLSDFSTEVVLDDGDETTHPYGNIAALAVVDATTAYFIGAQDYMTQNLYRLNPSTGVVTQSSIANLSGIQLSGLKLDPKGRLWVGDVSNASMHIIDPSTDTEIDSVSTKLPPIDVAF